MTVEKEIQVRLKRIFEVDKVTFANPGESQEQEGLFVEIKKSKIRIVDKREIAKVEGTIHIFANVDKMPVGFFSKQIAAADLADVRVFFFSPVESMGTFQNIAERKFDFTFLFDSQYDPSLGTLETVNFSFSET